MKFVDQAKIHLQAGPGGNGCSSFRREKYIPRGGPDGGDGGNGGAIYFVAEPSRTTLLDFQYRQHYKAEPGKNGKGKDMHGRRGQDLVLQVPPGTIVRSAETDEILLEVLGGEPQLAVTGGRGGKGNPRFRTSAIRAPEECEPGAPGEECWVLLELKLMADVGLVGYPNAGKSTFISRVSRATPKIADYPFTTLVPNLGVVSAGDFDHFVVADIPGIIEGAHEGAGLGLRFLRHIERTALLLLLVDALPPDGGTPLESYRVLLEELRGFSADLINKPRMVALTKADLVPDPAELEKLRAELEAEGEEVLAISAVSGQGIEPLVRRLADQVKTQRRAGEAAASEYTAPSIPHS